MKYAYLEPLPIMKNLNQEGNHWGETDLLVGGGLVISSGGDWGGDTGIVFSGGGFPPHPPPLGKTLESDGHLTESN